MENKFEQKANERTIPLSSMEGDSHIASHNELRIDVYRLIHALKEFPSTTAPVSDFAEQLGKECWTDESNKRISPNEVIDQIKNTDDYTELCLQQPNIKRHIEQILQADYSYPIVVYEGEILDGMHRLAKANLNGETEIAVKFLEIIPEEALIKE